MIPHILNSTSLILFINGKPVKVSKDAPVYAAVIKAFRLPEADQEAAILSALDKQNVNKNIEAKGFVVNGDEVIFEGEKLPAPLAQKILSLIKENLPVELFKNFWRNLKKNPAYHVVNETGFYDFLSYRELPLTQDGFFLGYRGVQKDGWSISGNPETKVLQGKVNERGQIYNGVGEIIEIERNGVNDDRNIHCDSRSIHIGSLKYALDWGSKVVVVKVNPRDVVCCPLDCECQKLRVCKFEVVGDFTEEIIAPVVSKNNTPVINTRFKKDVGARSKLTDRIDAYLSRKKQAGSKYVQAKSIQSIFSPACPSIIEILDAVTSLGYVWEDNSNGRIVKL